MCGHLVVIYKTYNNYQIEDEDEYEDEYEEKKC